MNHPAHYRRMTRNTAQILPYAPWPTERYQNAYVPSNTSQVDLTVEFSRPTIEGEGITIEGTVLRHPYWDRTLDLNRRVSFHLLGPTYIVPEPGTTSIAVPVRIVSDTAWFRDTVDFEVSIHGIGGVGINRAGSRHQIKVYSIEHPPFLSFASETLEVPVGASVVGKMYCSGLSVHSIRPNIVQSGDAGRTVFVEADTHNTRGDYSSIAEFKVFASAAAKPGDEITIELDHPSGYFLGNLVENPVFDKSNVQVVFEGENLWSNSPMLGTWEDNDWQAPDDGIFIAAEPSQFITKGGKVKGVPAPYMSWDRQPTRNPVLDPSTGSPIPVLCLAPGSPELSYLRESFGSDITGGPQMLRPCFPWALLMVRLEPSALDDLKTSETARIGLRTRTSDVNHHVTFRKGTLCKDYQGNDVPQLSAQGFRFHLWSAGDLHPEDEWGVLTTPEGEFVYLLHKTDGKHTYSNGKTPMVEEDRYNPILYPIAGTSFDGSLELNGGLEAIRENGTHGWLFHQISFSLHDEKPDLTSVRYRPTPGLFRAPEGNAHSAYGRRGSTCTIRVV